MIVPGTPYYIHNFKMKMKIVENGVTSKQGRYSDVIAGEIVEKLVTS